MGVVGACTTYGCISVVLVGQWGLAAALPFVFPFLFILVGKYITAAARAKITGRKLWKAQFLCHPIIVFFFTFLAGSVPHSRAKAVLALCITPFAFNWGVEPWDLPPDPIFFLCFYAHHLAPIAACLVSTTAPMAQALLFAHGWQLHTIGSLDRLPKNHWAHVSKQLWCGPYYLQGFLVQCFWWHSIGTSFGGQPSSEIVRLLPVLIQFAGRWGLYLRLEALMGHPQVTDPKYDALEARKQGVELGGFALAFLLVRMFLHR